MVFRLDLLDIFNSLEQEVACFAGRWKLEGQATAYRIALYPEGKVPDEVDVEPLSGVAAIDLVASALTEFFLQEGQSPGSVFRLPGLALCSTSMFAELESINARKDQLREAIISAEPSARARNTLVRRLFPGRNMLQVYRHIHFAGPDVTRIAFAWSPVTSASKIMTRDEASALIATRRGAIAQMETDLIKAYDIALETLSELSPKTSILQRRPVAPHPRVTLFNGNGRGAPKTTHHANLPLFIDQDQAMECGTLASYDPSARRRTRRDLKQLTPLLHPLHLYLES